MKMGAAVRVQSTRQCAEGLRYHEKSAAMWDVVCVSTRRVEVNYAAT